MHKYFIFSLLFMGTLFTGCQKHTSDTAALEQSSTFRPTVAIAPVIDHSESDLNWDVSDEITYSLSTRLVQKNKLSIVDPQKTKTQIKKIKLIDSPFGSDLMWVKKMFQKEDFVVFMELIEHSEQLKNPKEGRKPESLSAELNLALRLRIVDIRSAEPTIILQEIIQESHFIPKQFTKYNFQQAPWNSEEFSISPVGIAHSVLIKELSSRIEDYIFLSN